MDDIGRQVSRAHKPVLRIQQRIGIELLPAPTAWLLTTPAVSTTVNLSARTALIFPQPGLVPPNVQFLIALEFPRGKDVPADPSPSSLLLDPAASPLHLIDDAGHRIARDGASECSRLKKLGAGRPPSSDRPVGNLGL